MQHQNTTTAAPTGAERSEASVGAAGDAASHPRPKRRHFSDSYKLGILKRLDDATEPGSTTLILRQEGLYSSLLVDWRRWRDGLRRSDGTRRSAAAATDAPARSPGSASVTRAEHEKALRENDRLAKKLEQAQLLLELQKKLQDAVNALQNEGSTR